MVQRLYHDHNMNNKKITNTRKIVTVWNIQLSNIYDSTSTVLNTSSAYKCQLSVVAWISKLCLIIDSTWVAKQNGIATYYSRQTKKDHSLWNLSNKDSKSILSFIAGMAWLSLDLCGSVLDIMTKLVSFWMPQHSWLHSCCQFQLQFHYRGYN